MNRQKWTFEEKMGQFKPFKDEVVSQIEDVIGEEMSRFGVGRVFKTMAAKAGLDSKHSIHTLRHTYATNLYKASGYNLRMLWRTWNRVVWLYFSLRVNQTTFSPHYL